MLLTSWFGLRTFTRRVLHGRVRASESAQALMEYAIVLVLIAVVVVVILGVFGFQIANMFSRVTSSIAPY